MNWFGFAVGRKFALDEGVDIDTANKYGMAAALGSSGSLIPAIAVQRLARNDVESAKPAISTSTANNTVVKAKRVALPDVTGSVFEEAKKRLEAPVLGFSVAKSPVGSDSVGAGIVVDQLPLGPSVQPAGSAVTLFVSEPEPPQTKDGKPLPANPVQVPVVVGDPIAKARERLVGGLGFKMNEVEVGSEKPAGYVISQYPVGDTVDSILSKGSVVTVGVSKAKEALPTEPHCSEPNPKEQPKPADVSKTKSG